MSARLARIALGHPAPRTENRLTGDDLVTIAAAIHADLDKLRRPASIAEDFNRLAREVPRSIGCTNLDLRESELFEISDMVAAAILDHGYRLEVAR
jgi:hypothetical protein